MLNLSAIDQSLPIIENELTGDFKNFLCLLDDVKQRKTLLKMIEKKWWSDQYAVILSSWLKEAVNQQEFSLIKKISSLLELSYLTRAVVEDCFIDVFNYLVSIFKVLCENGASEINDTSRFNEVSIQAVKVFLQLIQFLHDPVHEALKNNSVCDFSMLRYLVILLTDKRFSRDCSLLCGTVFALLFNLIDQSQSVLNSLHEFLKYTGNIGPCKKTGIFLEKTWIAFSDVSSPYAQMSLIVGLLKAKTKVINMICDDGFPFFHVLFEVILRYCDEASDSSVKYLAFRAMQSWLLHIQTGKLISLYSKTLFIHKNSLYLEKLLNLIWCHVEDLIENIPVFVQDIFSLTLQLHKEECDLSITNAIDKEEFYNHLASTLTKQAWYIKGRWSLLSELVPYLGFKKLLNLHKRFCEELLECMNTSNLPVVANNFYTSVLKDMRNSFKTAQKAVDEWCTFFKTFLLSAMQNEHLAVRQNISQYLVPTTFKTFPETFDVLEEAFKSLSSISCSHAYITSLKYARLYKIITTQELELRSDALNSCLQNIDLNIRSEAFEVLCSNPKQTEPLTPAILSMVLQYISCNLNSDSTNFRQKFVSSLKKLLINVRESCVVLCKKNKESSELEDSIDFVEEVIWIARTCLCPLSSYQRKRTGLHLLELVTDTFIYVKDETKRHKGAPSENASELFEFVKNNNKKRWNILSSFDYDLLCCIEDQHDEIREAALKLLQYHQSLTGLTGLTGCLECLVDFGSLKKTLAIAFSLINSLKFHEAESGALLIQFISHRLVRNSLVSDNMISILISKESIKNSNEMNCLKEFSLYILSCTKDSWVRAQEDFLSAASSESVYGSILALAYFIKSFHDTDMQTNILSDLLNDSLKLFSSMANYLLRMLMTSEDFDESEISPSFADINNAIDVSLKRCPSYILISGRIGHAHCREMLLSFCWLNMKAISIVFTAFVELLDSKHREFMNIDNFTLMMEFYKQSLIKCRHKGIVESCYASFCIFAKVTSNIPVFWHELMRQCRETIVFCTLLLNSTSVTMRSVGIPMFVQAILSAEPSCEQGSFLSDIISQLIKIASTPLEDASRSLPQFNAISILRAVFRDTSLGAAVLPFVERGIILTINGFSSPSWSIRNASTQLLGALIQRMLGQRISQTEENSQNAGTADIFFYRYQNLFDYFVSSLKNVSRSMLFAHVIPVLIILSKLHPSSTLQNERCHEILLTLSVFKSSPVWKVRDLTSKAILALTPTSKYAEFCEEIYEELSATDCQNTTHSLLMLLLKMSFINDSRPSKKVYKSIFTVLSRLSGKTFCSISQSIIVDTLVQCCTYFKSKEVFTFALSYVTEAITSLSKGLDVGRPYLEKSLAKAVAYFAKDDLWFDDQKTISLITSCSHSGLHLQFLKYISPDLHQVDINFQALLVRFVLKTIELSQSQLLLRTALICLNSLSKMKWADTKIFGIDEELLTSRFFKLLLQFPGLGSNILPNLYKVISKRLQNVNWSSCLIDDLKNTCNLIQRFSQPEEIEDLRFAAAESIGLLEDLAVLLPSFQKERITINSLGLLSSLFSSCLQLLQDEDEDIRKIATLNVQFVWQSNKNSTFSNNSHLNSVHPNIALAYLFSFIEDAAKENEFACRWLVETLCKKLDDKKDCELLLFEQEAANLFMEENVAIDLAASSLKNVLTSQNPLPFLRDSYRIQLEIYTEQLYETLQFKQETVNGSKSIFGLFGVRKHLMELYLFIKCVQIFEVGNAKHIQFLKDLTSKYLLPSVIYSHITGLSGRQCSVNVLDVNVRLNGMVATSKDKK